MQQQTPHKHHFAPAQNGSLWPYVILPIIGAGIMIYLTLDTYWLVSRSGVVHPNDGWVLWAMGGVTGLFFLMAVALWYAPWSWASLDLTDTDFTIEITGLNARKATTVLWSALTQVTIMNVPRGASYYRLDLRDQPSITIRTLALAADPADVLPAFEEAARAAGYQLSGKALTEPLIGLRRWQVTPIA